MAGVQPEQLVYAKIVSVVLVKEGGFNVVYTESDNVQRKRYVPHDLQNPDFSVCDTWYNSNTKAPEVQTDPLQTDTGDDTGV